MRLCATFIFTLIIATLFPASDGWADSQPTEYQLKAAYLYHFAQFVDWPASAFATTNSPLVIGVLGQNPFGDDLRHTVEGKVINSHPLMVKEFQSLAEVTNNCQILFISSSVKRLPEVFAALKGSSILTVGESDSDHFVDTDAGMINFVLDGSRIRFQINEINVENAGLKMSFKLLSLASKVIRP